MSKDSVEKINYQEKTHPVGFEVLKRKQFSDREVGLTHPDLSSFIRLSDDGDIEIFAAPGVGIVISAKGKSISLFADSVRVFSKEDGFRWNNYNFNYSASSYVEPTLVKINKKFIHSSQNNVDYYLESISKIQEQENQIPITINGDYGFSSVEQQVPVQQISPEYDTSDLSDEQLKLIEIYKTDLNPSQITKIIMLLKQGITFENAYKVVIKE